MNYPDSVQFLYSLGNEIKTAKLGLDRIRTLLEALGNPQDRCRFVHVAGTNGKGSTCAMIESGLRAAGVRTGLFTSPHLVEPVERICVDGRPVSADEFANAFNRVHQAAERLIDSGALDLHPTYFETVTAMGFLVFAAQPGIERTVVLEVGLGGRLDATNVIDKPVFSVITPIDFDHEAWLGTSLEAIAGEKAGIIKPRVPVVIADQRLEAGAVLEAKALERRAPFIRSSEWEIHQLVVTAGESRFTLTREGRTFPVACPLAGEYQVQNARTAAAVLDLLAIPPERIEAGIRQVRWPGRLEHLGGHPGILLDGAHNPAGARALAAYLERFYHGRRIHLIYGAMRDKAVAEIIGILSPLAYQVIVTAPCQARAARPEAIADLADHPNLRTAPALDEALALARSSAAEDDLILITGSLFLVGEAKSLL
jgi:dihydrofolate synthase/folylpolyglutamate synthase